MHEPPSRPTAERNVNGRCRTKICSTKMEHSIELKCAQQPSGPNNIRHIKVKSIFCWKGATPFSLSYFIVLFHKSVIIDIARVSELSARDASLTFHTLKEISSYPYLINVGLISKFNKNLDYGQLK